MNFSAPLRRNAAFWIVCVAIALIAVVLTVVFAISLAPIDAKALHLSRTEWTFLSFSETHQLEVTLVPEEAAEENLVWSSSDSSVVSVEDGLLIPHANGTATVTVTSQKNHLQAQCRVTVNVITHLDIDLQELYISVGSVRSLTYSSLPENPDITHVVWSSSDPSVARVDAYGKVTGISEGTAKITLSSLDGSVSDACDVFITANVPLETLAFDITSYTFRSEADSLVLTPVYVPAETSQRELQWMSTNEQVVTVDPATGKITALSNGTASIIIKSIYGDITAVCEITVEQSVPVTGISLSKKSYTFSGLKQTYRINPVFEPSNASDKTVIWTSSDPSVATVSDQGMVTSVKKGETVIRLETKDGGFTAEFKVIVSPNDRVSVTGVVLSDYTLVFDALGKTQKITASVKPSNASEKGIRFSSNNSAVATVSSDGTVTATGYGTTQIVATSVDGGYSEVCTVTVNIPVIEVPPSETEEFVKGVWVATVANIDFPSKIGLSAEEMKAEIDTIMNNAASWGLNTVYFQVRPSGDALYPSEYYPSSYYIVSKQGDELPLDILAYAIEAAHARGLELHAWINPYRVTNDAKITLDSLADTNPAKMHPEWVLTDGKKLYLNPGLPEVRAHIVGGVLEIVKNYDVDGIHFDDYFYPTVNKYYDDSAAYQAYGAGMSLEDWRRSNTDALVKAVYDAVKSQDSSVSFGISPAPVWRLKYYDPNGVEIKSAHQTYSEAFADTRKWVKEGWLDYICPQVYFQRDHSTAPFAPIVDWWNETVKDTDVRLYIGIGAYRCEDTEAYQTGKEIPAQLEYLETKDSVNGAVLYNYSSLKKNYAGVADAVKDRYYVEPISTTLQFNQASITVDSSYKFTYVVGVSDPNFPLYADGKIVDRTREGYFSYPVTLTENKTVVTFTHKGKTVEYVITRTSSGGSSGDYLKTFSFAPDSFTPSYDTADKSGTEITFSCVAPAGSEVRVQIGNYSVPMSTKTKDPNNGKYRKATYTGTMILPQVDNNGNGTLGYPVFYATRKGESVSYSPGCLLEIINDPSSYAMEVSVDKSDIRPNLEVDPEFFYIATEGAKVHVISKANGTVKLTNGMYMAVEDVVPADKSFGPASVKSSALSVSEKYTVLSLKMTERAFHTVWMDNEFVQITLYGMEGEIPSFSVGENPLFASSVCEWVDASTLRITMAYKASKHIYGYYCVFDGTNLYINFRNPVTLADGDKPLSGVVISLDPGHSQNSGAVRLHKGKEVWESNLNMDLSKRTADKLRALGATVVLTHQGEQTYSLDELIVQYRALAPDANVSIHFNASDALVSGTETFWCYGNSQLLGEQVLKTFCDITGFNARKNMRDYYKVSRLCEFPSILFETAYMSNPGDLAYFMDSSNMDIAADAIAQGILNFFREQNN